jgi:phosphoinositide-3-kinase regulatory subunit 4
MAPTAPSIAVSAYVDVLDEIQYKRPIGTSRFLKTVKAQDPDGAIVVKIFIKPSEEMGLSRWHQVIQGYKRRLSDVPSALSYTKIIETDRAGYLIRQFIKTNVYDRISTRPFLEEIEKKWIVFQLLNTLSECHERGVVHGDIKTENVLVTSWNWALLSDFAPFKPIYLPEDNPGSFSFYFDTSQRRTCYLAPERFIGTGEVIPQNDTVTSEMDIFSLGCVIAEIFLEGTPILTLSELYKYRKGDFQPDLSGIQDAELRELVTSMISLNPSKRLSAKEYLEKYKGTIFPVNFYNFIYEYFKSFNEEIPYNSVGNVYECDSRINRLYNDYDKIAYFLGYKYEIPEYNEEDEVKLQRGELTPIRLSLPGIPKNYNMLSTSKVKEKDKIALVILSFIFTALRNVRQEASKIQALELILALAERINDEGKLDRCLPYIVSLLDDTSINVQAKSLKTMTQLLLLVDAIGPVNVSLFSEYIIPRISKLVSSPNSYVRMTAATCLPYLAQTSLRFYYMGSILKDNVLETFVDPETENDGMTPSGIFEVSKETLSADFETFAISMLTDMDSSVKISLLRNILPLCAFFGKEKTNDLILSHLITYLNDKSPQLRVAFVEAVIGLSIYVGTISLEHYILPLLVQTLSDPEELVVIKVLHIFEDLATLGLIRKDFIWDLLTTVSKLLLHPNEWIRQSALSLIAAFAETLSLAELYCMLYPIIRPYIEYDVTDFSWDTLYSVCKRPLSRPVYNLASTWSLRAEKTFFWKQVKSSLVDVFGNRGLDFMSNPVSTLNGSRFQSADSVIFGNLEIPLSPEDKSWLDRLKSSGLTDQELWKIADLREYIYRVSRLNSRTASKDFDEHGLSIQQLGVLPRNIFFDAKVHAEPFAQATINENFGSIDDRLPIDSFAANSSSGEIAEDDRTLIMNPTPFPDDMSRSLILGKPKAAPSILAQEQNVYGELESSFQRERRPSTQAQRLKTTKILTSVVTNSYTGKDPYVIRYLNTVKLEPSLDEFSEFTQVESMPLLDFSKSWIPTGELVAHLKEHKTSINSLDVCPDHSYFITADNFGVLKIWDTSRLERNIINSSVLTVELDKPITKIKFLTNYHCFAVSTRDGYVRLMSVNFNKSKKVMLIESVTIIREMMFSDEFIVDLTFGNKGQNNLIFSVTSLSQIVVIDIRNMDIVFKLQNNPSFGVITAIALAEDNSWALVGTSKGILSLWDVRFKTHLKSWRFKSGFSINRIVTCSNDYHLNRKKGRFVIVTGGSGNCDAGIFDVSVGLFREIFTRSSGGNTMDKFSLLEVDETFGDLPTKVEDLKISDDENKSMTALKVVDTQFETTKRKFWAFGATPTYDLVLWNVHAPEESRVVLGPIDSKASTAFIVSQMSSYTRIVTEKYATESETESVKKRRRHRGLMNEDQESLIKRHHDIITDIGMVLKPYEMIISADRSGSINLYR